MVTLPKELHTASLDPPTPTRAKRPPAAFIITAGALDDASNQCLLIWLERRITGEGLHAWLLREGVAAIASRSDMDASQFEHAGARWTFGAMASRPALVKVENLQGFRPAFSAGFLNAVARYKPYGRER